MSFGVFQIVIQVALLKRGQIVIAVRQIIRFISPDVPSSTLTYLALS